uniref:Uncharacterized protein n=1 Tax=Solanum lycopersicum TaxID=4081 RepID=A0A3Q7I6U0_SOLLC
MASGEAPLPIQVCFKKLAYLSPSCDLWNDPFSTMKRINGMPNQEMWLVEK